MNCAIVLILSQIRFESEDSLHSLDFSFVLGVTYLFGRLLPEGIMRDLPLPSLLLLGETLSFFNVLVRTIVTNVVIGLVPIFLRNHLRVKTFMFGYIWIYTQTALMRLFAGTNCFAGGISAHIIEEFLLFLQIGFVEFSAYTLFCIATIHFAMYHANR